MGNVTFPFKGCLNIDGRPRRDARPGTLSCQKNLFLEVSMKHIFPLRNVYPPPAYFVDLAAAAVEAGWAGRTRVRGRLLTHGVIPICSRIHSYKAINVYAYTLRSIYVLVPGIRVHQHGSYDDE